MQAAFQILSELGLNHTVIHQMGLFFVAYFFLSRFLFTPYIRNIEYRRKLLGMSGGSTASQLQAEIEQLQLQYQEKLRKENERTQEIFNKYRTEAINDAEKTIASARQRAARMVDEAKSKIQSEIKTARDQLATEVPQMSSLIAGKILGRELK